MSKTNDGLGATDDEVKASLQEDVALAFKLCNQQRARIATLERELAVTTKQYEFLNKDFLELMNDIGRYGEEKYGADSFHARAVLGDRSRGTLKRTRSEDILRHVRQHMTDYENGVLHDHFGTVDHQLAAASFNLMMEYYFPRVSDDELSVKTMFALRRSEAFGGVSSEKC